MIITLATLTITTVVLATYAFAQANEKFDDGKNGEDIGVGLLEQISKITSKPNLAGLIAIGGLKDDTKCSVKDKIKHLEELLVETKSLTMRNAIRMTLKDLYAATRQEDKLIKSLKEMAAENDAAMEKWEGIIAENASKKK